jgi:hypothetical protein
LAYQASKLWECCAASWSAAPPEDDGDRDLAAGHVEHLGRGVHDLVDGEEREVPGHELHDGPQAHHRRAHADAGEPQLGDRRVHDARRPELLEEPAADLVGALVDGDLLPHQEDGGIAPHLLAQRLVQRVPVGDDGHVRSPG